jgi:hypothetical protein
MRLRYSLVVTLSVMIIGVSLLSSSCAAKRKEVITEQQVLALLDEIDKASNKMDVDQIYNCMAENIQIKLTVTGLGPTQKFTFTRDQYRDYAKKAFSAINNYSYTRKNTKVTITSDNKNALATDQVYETTQVGNRSLRTVTDETATFTVKDGKVIMTSLEGVARPN